MNDQQVAELFRRAGDTLEPDVVRLVATGTALGASRRRRRRRGVCVLAVAATMGVLAVPATMILGSDGVGDAGDTSVAGAGDREREVAIPAAQMSATLAALLPGAVLLDDDQPYQYQIRRGVVEWRDVKVTLSIDSRGVGSSTTARARCEAFMADACAQAPDGGWLATFGTIEDVNAPVEDYYAVVRLYEPDGYVIEATGERGPAQAVDEGGGSAADPTVLRRLVLDGGWLR